MNTHVKFQPGSTTSRLTGLPNNNRLAVACQHSHALRQRGVVLFFALIALVVMSLAAVALIRSVDTSTMIAGNLAFKQAAASSGDAGLESAIQAMLATQNAMDTAGLNVFQDPTHELNITNAAVGYYSNADPALNLTDPATWAGGSTALAEDSSGNTVSYIVQRMCRTANGLLSTWDCLFGGAAANTGSMAVKLASNVCIGSGCPAPGQAVMYRITSRITGPRNTVSYVQSFVY